MTTPRLGAPELVEGQAAPETTVNEIVRILEAGAGFHAVLSKGTTAPPGSPVDGNTQIVGAAATGAWSGFTAGNIALYMGSAGWVEIPVREGIFAYDQPNDRLLMNDGSGGLAAWVEYQRKPSIQSVTSSATVTPTFTNDQVNITAQAAGLTLANPTGTAVPAWGIAIRIKDNGGAQSISYGTQYRAMGVTLPTTTVASKTLYLAMIYNSTDTKWDVVAVAQEA